MAFTPMFVSLLVTTSSKLTDSIIDHVTAVSAGELTAKLVGLNTVTSAIPGGVVIGVLLFGLMFFGAIALFIGLMIERFGMEIGTLFFALVAGLYVHPRWKTRVTKAGYTIAGLILDKPQRGADGPRHSALTELRTVHFRQSRGVRARLQLVEQASRRPTGRSPAEE
jgi:hypothetical protein